MDHGSDMGAYSESSNVQNGSNYITIIPVEYPRRGYPVQAEYQYSDYRTREEYYNIQTQKLQAEVNAHLYSVSQRLPQLSSYSPIGRHNDWDKHSDMQKTLQNETKESNSSDSLEKSIMGSNMSSCSNQTASSSTAAGSFSTTEQITSGNSTFSAISPPLPGTGSSGSTTSSSSVNSPTIICVYMMSRTAVMVELAADEVPAAVTASRLLAAVLSAEELGLTQASRALATNVFSLWMCSPLLEVQLSGQQCPWQVCTRWRALVTRYGHGSPNRLARDHPILRVQRNLFYPTHHEESIKDSRIQELLFEESRRNVVGGRYPLEAAQALTLAGLQARIQLGPYDPHVHTTQFFRDHQDNLLPAHARSGRYRRLLPPGGKTSPEARLAEHMQRAPATATARKLTAKYQDFCRALPFYGAAFFQGQIEQPVRGLTSLLTHEDIPVLVAVNSNGVYVIDDAESTMLLGLRYEELSWDLGMPSDEGNEDCLPCLFLQFMVVENGLRVSKILQVFSKQGNMMDTLIEYFANEFRKRVGDDSPGDQAHYEYHSDATSISLPPLSRPDSPQRRLANKLSRLALATHDGRGHLLGGAGQWHEGPAGMVPDGMDGAPPSWLFPKH